MRPDTPKDPLHQSVMVGRSTLTYTDTGRGRAVVAVHGLPASSRDFRWLDAALADRVRLLRLDLPGFGHSTIENPEGASFSSMAEAVRQFVETMDLRSAVLLGHSAGGAIALEAAVGSERIDGVVLVNSNGPVMHNGNFPRVYRAMASFADASRLARSVLLRLARPVLVRMGFSKQLSSAEILLAARLNGHYQPARFGELVDQLDRPLLVAWSPIDPVVQAEVSRRTLDAAHRPTEVRLDAKTHNLQSTHATELADAIVLWMDQLPSSP